MKRHPKYEQRLCVALAAACRSMFGDRWFEPRLVVSAGFRDPVLSTVLRDIAAEVGQACTPQALGRRVAAYLRHVNEVDSPYYCNVRRSVEGSAIYYLSYQIVERATVVQKGDQVVGEAKDPSSVGDHAIDRAAAAIIASQERCATRIIDAIVDEFRSAWAPAKRNG